VVGLAWSNDPKSYGSSRVVTGRATHARDVKDKDPDKKAIPWSSTLGIVPGANCPTP
jgi:hypothetical protein